MDTDSGLNSSTDRSSFKDTHAYVYSHLNLFEPASQTTATPTTIRSRKDIENDLFENIEQLVREFINQPHDQYPYYRVMRWTIGEQPKIEDFVTVVINQSISSL